MPFYSITGAYLDPGEGPVEPYGWSGEAKNRKDAEQQMQDACRDSMETDDEKDLIEVIDVWEIHPDDYREGPSDFKTWVRMRPVR